MVFLRRGWGWDSDLWGIDFGVVVGAGLDWKARLYVSCCRCEF